MSDINEEREANLSNATKVHRSIAEKLTAHKASYPATDANGMPITAEQWVRRPQFDGTTYLGRANELDTNDQQTR